MGILWQVLEQVVGDVHQRVNAGQVGRAEGGGARVAHRRPGDGVHLLDLVAFVQHTVDGGHEAEGADAVADEVGRIFTIDDALAEPLAAERAHVAHDGGIGARAGYQLQQLHEADGVVVVRDEEVALEVVATSLDQHRGR